MSKAHLLLKRATRSALLFLLLSAVGMANARAQSTQTTTFAQGWNWWNTYIEQDGIDGLGMLEEALGSNGSVIKTQCDGYAINIPDVGWCGNLQGLNNESTYMIRTESDCTVNMTGDEAVPSNHPITLYPGWTWIGFPTSTEMSVGEAFSNIALSNGDKVWSQNTFGIYYSTMGIWMGQLQTIMPGVGLQFYSNNSQQITLTYPDGTRGMGLHRDITENNHWTPNMHQYRYNMIVTGVVKLNGVEAQSDQYEVGAFVGDECRGSARPVYVQGLNRYVVFLTVEGENENEQVSFKLYDCTSGVELEGASGLAFIANDAVGLPFDVPYEFGFTGMTTYVVTTEANPAAGGTVTGTGNYYEGATCTLTATPNEGYTFINWTEDGEVVSTNATYSFTVAEAGDYVANFTISVPGDAPVGAINGVFSVGDSTQVYFSQGNLQYIGSATTPYWKFADNQWDIIGSSQANTQQTTDRDLFCWGTSGYNHGANQYQPWSYLGPNSDYYAYGDEESNLFDGDGRADWGYNAILNGGNTENIGWRTLTEEEWLYLFNTRNTASGIRFVRATVNDVGGIIFLPDNWNADTYELNETNNLDGSINNNIISAEDWVATFEANGAVFLPIAGWMQMDNGGYFYSNPGAYWSSTVLNANTAWYYDVYYYYNGYGSGHLIEFTDHHDRGNKRSVRLAINIDASPLTGYTINATPNPAEGGTVTGGGSFEAGQTCTLTATANAGYTFTNWTENGEVVSTEATYSFTVTEAGNYVANFTNLHWTPNNTDYEENMPVTAVVAIDGEEQQSATLELGAFCGEECRGSQRPLYFEPTQRYIYQMTVFGEEGDEITFRLYDHATNEELGLASPEAMAFGAIGYGTLPSPVVLNFRHSYEITATANPTAVGTVEGGGTYLHGDTCTLTATANTGYTFINWTLDGEVVSTEAAYSFTVTEASAFVANFELNSYAITATANPTEGGTVAGAGTYNHFSTCTLTATANTGYTFINWTLDGEVVSTEAAYSFTVTEASAFVANFELNSYAITATANPTEGGTVAGAGTYNHFSTCTLTATPSMGYTFINWTLDGEEVSTEATYSFTVTEASAFVANFVDVSSIQTTTFNQGWNWWSGYVGLDGSEGLEALESGLDANGIIIKSQNDGYVSYLSGFGWYGSLAGLYNEQSYRVKADAACTVQLQGSLTDPADHPVTLNPGWTWMGFPWNQAMSVEAALEGFEPEANDFIKGRNAYTMYYNENGYSLWFGPLNSLEPGQGYVYYSNSGEVKTLTFNTNGGRSAQPNVTADDNLFRPETGNYADNMTLTAVVDLDGGMLRSESYEVAAFCNGECRGSAKLAYFAPKDSYVAFLTLYGNDGDELEFVLTDGTTAVASGEAIRFAADAHLGTLSAPCTLRFGTLGLDESQASVKVYPNPTKDVFNVEGEGIRRVDVFNAFGQEVLVEETTKEAFRIDLGGRAAGVYMLRVVTESGVTTRQLVKE